MFIIFILEMVLSYPSSIVESYFSSLLLMYRQTMNKRNLTGLEHINIPSDLSSTRDYRMLLYIIDIMEKMLGLWDANLFFLLLMWTVLGLWLSYSRILWPFAGIFTNQTSFSPWLLISSGQKLFRVFFLDRQLLIVLTLYHRFLSKRRKHSLSWLIMAFLVLQ